MDFDSLVADDIKVRVYGDTAIVTYRATVKGKDQGGTIDEQRRWTRVFRSRERAVETGPRSRDNDPKTLKREAGLVCLPRHLRWLISVSFLLVKRMGELERCINVQRI